MQTTLLSLAIAAILVLVTALFGPHFVDWTRYRDLVEARASQVVGTPVRVRGPIDLRLLPIPWMSAANVEIGGGEAKLRARALVIEFAFSPMLRGEWRATQMRLVGPDIALSLDHNGRLDGAPALPGLDPDNFSIEHLAIEDGRVRFADAASGARRTLEKVWFSGDLKSLTGPVRGEGGFFLDEARYGYRISLARAAEDGTRARITLEATDEPLTVETDGTLRMVGGVPRLEGGLTVTRASARTRGAASGGGGGGGLAWRMTSKLRASPAGATFEQIELQYGAEERSARFTGAAEFKSGRSPRLDGALSSRQIDLDTLLALPEPRAPLDAVKALAQLAKGAPHLPIAARFGFSVDGVSLAGGQLTNVRGDFKMDGGGWDLERIEMRAPGLSQIRLSGRSGKINAGMTFVGPATVEAGDAKALFAWMEGRSDAQPLGAAGLMRASGTLTLGDDRVAVDGLKVEVDRKSLEGRMAYIRALGSRPARLEAELKAADFDADALYASLQKVIAGTTSALPSEIRLALDFGKATLFGVQATGVAAHARFDESGLAIERLAIGDLGGAAFQARGRVEEPLGAPHGALSVDLVARDLGGLVTVLSKFSPTAAEQVRKSAQRLTPVKLRLNVKLDRAADVDRGAPTASLDLEGRAGVIRVGLVADANGTLSALRPSDWKLDGRLDADDGSVLTALLGLDRAVSVDRRGAWLRLVASGIAAGAARVDGRLVAGGLDAAAKGSLVLGEDKGLSGALDLAVSAANANLLRHASNPGSALPLALKTRLSIAGLSLGFEDITGVIAGQAVRGKLDVALSPSPRVTGRIDADSADANGLANAVLGLSPPSEREGPWSPEPFAARFGELAADVDFKLTRATLGPRLVVREVGGKLRAGGGRIALENLAGRLDAGQLTGQVAFTLAREASSLQAQLALRGAEATFGLSGEARPRVAGLVTLAGEFEGAGLSPATLVGSLKGTGLVSFERGEVLGLDARVFDRVTRAADQGLPLDVNRVGDFVTAALDSGRLPFGRAEAPLTLIAGQLRLSPLSLRSEGAELAISGQVDLADAQADARLTLMGVRAADGAIRSAPEISISLKGPMRAAKRNVEVSALVAWLTLRSVERQSKRIEAIESAERETDGGKPAAGRPAASGAQPRGAVQPVGSAAPPAPGASPSPAPPVTSAATPRPDAPAGAIEMAPPLPPAIEILPTVKPRRSEPAPRHLPRPPGAIPQGPIKDRPAAVGADAPARSPARTVLEFLQGLQR